MDPAGRYWTMDEQDRHIISFEKAEEQDVEEEIESMEQVVAAEEE